MAASPENLARIEVHQLSATIAPNLANMGRGAQGGPKVWPLAPTRLDVSGRPGLLQRARKSLAFANPLWWGPHPPLCSQAAPLQGPGQGVVRPNRTSSTCRCTDELPLSLPRGRAEPPGTPGEFTSVRGEDGMNSSPTSTPGRPSAANCSAEPHALKPVQKAAASSVGEHEGREIRCHAKERPPRAHAPPQRPCASAEPPSSHPFRTLQSMELERPHFKNPNSRRQGPRTEDEPPCPWPYNLKPE